MYKTIPENTLGNDYVVGDIHGMFPLLESLLLDLNFDKTKDRLIALGDLVDRGNHSHLILNYIDQDWFVSVRGNHEDLTSLSYLGDPLYVDNHVRNGGFWFEEMSPKNREIINNYFISLPIMLETIVNGKSIGFVHADIKDWDTSKYIIKDLSYEKSLLDYTCNSLQWGRSRIKQKNSIRCKGIDHVFLGHTPMKEMVTLGNCSFIDTAACFGNKLTIINIKEYLREINA